MASEQFSSRPEPKLLTPRKQSFQDLCQTFLLQLCMSPTKNDWEILFQPMFDEYLNPPPSVDLQVPEVFAPKPAVSTVPSLVNPKSYKERLNSPVRLKACKDELNEIFLNCLRSLLPRPIYVMVINLKWLTSCCLGASVLLLHSTARYEHGVTKGCEDRILEWLLREELHVLGTIYSIIYNLLEVHKGTPLIQHGKAVDPTTLCGMIGTLCILQQVDVSLYIGCAVCTNIRQKPPKSITCGYANFPDTYDSGTIPMVVLLSDRLESWSSKKQKCTAISSTEAEYIALTILDICPRVEGINFTDVPDDDTTLAFLIKLGYKGLLYKHTNMFMDHMHQPWRTLAAIINKCLSRKTASTDKLRKFRIDILWGVLYRENVDYPELIWEDLAF
ncbi:hypothetical protein Tco_0528783 [Tanacetum coccineum]